MSKTKSKKLAEIEGSRISELNFQFEKLGDFLFYEGPILSHLISQKNEDFLIQWCGNDQDYNRWLLFKTDYHLLHKYLSGKLTDFDLLSKNPDKFAYIIDIDNDVIWRKIWKIALDKIPEEYLPSLESKYDSDDFEPYTEKLKSYLEFHFNRQQKLYKQPSKSIIEKAAEPPPPTYGIS